MVLFDMGRFREALAKVEEVLRLHDLAGNSLGPSEESLARRGAIHLELGNLSAAVADLENARDRQTRMGDRLVRVDTLTYLGMAYARLGDADRALATSAEAVALLEEMGWANYQPQRAFYHHYLILKAFNLTPRLPYLQRAVEFIDLQASTLSRAQARRFRQGVRLNRQILDEWSRANQVATASLG